jgi:hypothetical protein
VYTTVPPKTFLRDQFFASPILSHFGIFVSSAQ